MGFKEGRMKICVFGLWHLGAVVSSCLSKLGHKVIGLDFDKEIIQNFQNGKAPIFEPGLDELIEKNMRKGNLSYTYDALSALKDAEVLWVTFDTPVDDNDNADIDFVIKNINNILKYVKNKTKIIISSQVPVGFTRKLEDRFKKLYPNKTVYIAYSPENLRLGKALKVFLEPDRIIIGINPDDKEKYLLISKV